MARFISHDPYARQETWSETVHTSGTCKNCGYSGKVLKSGYHLLYIYWIADDNGKEHKIAGKFCSIGCMRAYHGE